MYLLNKNVSIQNLFPFSVRKAEGNDTEGSLFSICAAYETAVNLFINLFNLYIK